MTNALVNARIWRPLRHNMNAIAIGLEQRAEGLAACREVGERVGFVGGLAKDRLMAVIVAHEAETVAEALSIVERQFGHHTDPVGVLAPAVAGLEAEIAKAIVDRPSLVDLDRQRIVRPVADH